MQIFCMLFPLPGWVYFALYLSVYQQHFACAICQFDHHENFAEVWTNPFTVHMVSNPLILTQLSIFKAHQGRNGLSLILVHRLDVGLGHGLSKLGPRS